VLNAIDPNLMEFFAQGGKLLLYHGWNDAAIAPQNTANYYSSVVAAMGGSSKVTNSMRFFMAPGVNHCTRSLCPYPQVAKYKGSGSTDDASNFVCTNE
jgi:feruloyl esterase